MRIAKLTLFRRLLVFLPPNLTLRQSTAPYIQPMSRLYFASDFHLGAPNFQASRERERRICQWLDTIADDAKALYLLGDVFDFWFEYHTVVPKGFLHFFARLVQLRERGVEIHLFAGNHDMWMRDFFTQELGIHLHRDSLQFEHNGKRFFLAHGDGLGPHDKGYKRLKKVFRARLCQWLFRWIHPDWGTALASFLSRRSRSAQPQREVFESKEKEWLYLYAERKSLQLPEVDYFIFGHRHLPLDIRLNNGRSRYINLGEWLSFDTFASFEGQELHLQSHSGEPIFVL